MGDNVVGKLLYKNNSCHAVRAIDKSNGQSVLFAPYGEQFGDFSDYAVVGFITVVESKPEVVTEVKKEIPTTASPDAKSELTGDSTGDKPDVEVGDSSTSISTVKENGREANADSGLFPESPVSDGDEEDSTKEEDSSVTKRGRKTKKK
jgi:hypothetical protein